MSEQVLKGKLKAQDGQIFYPDTGLDNIICEDGSRLNTKLQGGMELLWTNPSPSAAFTAQTITLDLSSYGAVLITSCRENNIINTDSRHTDIIRVGDSGQLIVAPQSAATAKATFRAVSVSTSGVTFANASALDTNSASGVYAIPLYIYGIRLAPIYINQATETPFRFGIDADGNYGYYKGGSNDLIPFNSPTYRVVLKNDNGSGCAASIGLDLTSYGTIVVRRITTGGKAATNVRLYSEASSPESSRVIDAFTENVVVDISSLTGIHYLRLYLTSTGYSEYEVTLGPKN